MSRSSSVSARILLLGLLAGVLSAGGCSAKIWVIQTPDFYTPKLKTIAVVPFRNQTDWRGAGDILGDKLASALMANGAYTVFNRNDLKTVLDEQDIARALSGDPAAVAAKLRNPKEVQAILTGTVTTYAATSNSQNRQDPVYATNAQGQLLRGGVSHLRLHPQRRQRLGDRPPHPP